VLLASDGTLIEGSRNHVEAWDVLEGETIPGFLQRMGGPDGRVDLTGTALISAGLQTPVWTSEEGFIRQAVLPGDTLRLAVLGNHVYVAGAVHNPGSVLYQSGMTVQQCIDMAGGAQNAGRTGRTLLSRNGAVLARGGSALAMNARPGDVIEVPYSVESRYQTSIVILASLVTMTATIINLTRN
jgi:protein involved in polysaccharide export with SLBB domain